MDVGFGIICPHKIVVARFNPVFPQRNIFIFVGLCLSLGVLKSPNVSVLDWLIAFSQIVIAIEFILEH